MLECKGFVRNESWLSCCGDLSASGYGVTKESALDPMLVGIWRLIQRWIAVQSAIDGSFASANLQVQICVWLEPT